MFKIGITGSIGTGKTTIANMFALFNIPIFDADKEIKQILNKNKIKQKLKNRWPDVINKNVINKHKLKSIVFSRKKEKKDLEKMLYPCLKIEKNKFETTNNEKNILVYDVPLIYETNSQNEYDLILLTYCDSNLQRRRVLDRDKISDTLFEKITKSQLSFSKKVNFKPKVINTDNKKIFLFLKIALLLIEIKINLKIKNGRRKKANTRY